MLQLIEPVYSSLIEDRYLIVHRTLFCSSCCLSLEELNGIALFVTHKHLESTGVKEIKPKSSPELAYEAVTILNECIRV